MFRETSPRESLNFKPILTPSTFSAAHIGRFSNFDLIMCNQKSEMLSSRFVYLYY